jgi:hypothetical protein
MFWSTYALASGDLIADGGFENHQAQTQPERFFAGSGFGGWQVGGQGDDHVDLHYDPLNAHEGNQYLFMAHSGADVSQVVMLQPGHNYELHVSASAVRDHGSGQLDIVSHYPSDTLQNSYPIGSALVDENPLVPPFAPPLTWHQYQFNFTAQAEQERIFFRNGSSAYLLTGLLQNDVSRSVVV